VALATLKEIIENGAYKDVALRRILAQESHLNPTQRAFVTEVVSGVMRNLLLLDHTLQTFSKTPINRIKTQVLHILRLAVYQIKFMDKVQDYAAINEAVEMAKKSGFGGLSGFVNGILRNIARAEGLPETDDLSIKYSIQPWIVEHFTAELGEETTRELLENITAKPPKITICINTNKTTADRLTQILEAEGVSVTPANVDGMLTITKTANIAALPSFNQGLYHIMDEAAAHAIHAAKPPKNAKIIDVCAAPGGKSFLAAYLTGDGGQILACDIHDHKIKLLKEGANRLSIKNFTAELADARQHRKDLEETADLVIMDMPCSGLGTLRRKPDIKQTKQPEAIEELAKLSREIFEACWKYAKIGGKILFSTCTIAKAENADNVDWALANFPLKLEVQEQILPQTMNTDGFFIAVMTRAT